MPFSYLKRHAHDIGLIFGLPMIVFFSIFIVYHQPNPFSPYYYYGGIFVLCFISFLLNVNKKSGWIPVCNYAMVVMVLFRRPLNIPENLTFLFYPLINGLIFRRHRENIYVTMPLALLASVGLMVFDTFYPFILLFDVILCLANFYRSEEDKMIINENKVYDSFDNLLRERNITRQTYEISRRFLKEWNETHRGTRITDIETYFFSQDNYFLINSVKFSWQRRLHLSENQNRHLASGRIYGEGIKRNGVEHFEYLVPVKVDSKLYVVRYSLYYKGISWFERIGIERILFGVSGKLVNILVVVHKLKRFEASYIEENKAKKNYIDRAIGTMHFIRNRLTSIANLVEYMRLPQEEKALIPENMVRDLVKSSSHDYGSIKKYADDLLNKEKYPFADNEIEEIQIKSLFTYVAETVENHLRIYVETEDNKNLSHLKVRANFFELKTILTDWISNMEKYGRNCSVRWSLNNTEISIIFKNTAQLDDVQRVEEALSNDNIEIPNTRKRTFGINFIRELALKNNITIRVDVENKDSDDEAVLSVSFKIPVKNEE